MKVFIAKNNVSLFGEIDVKKNDKIVLDSDYNLTHNGVSYTSPVNQIGLELFDIVFSLKETRNHKLKLLGI